MSRLILPKGYGQRERGFILPSMLGIGRGGGAPAGAHRWWRIRAVGTGETDAQKFWAETQFLDSAGATAQPGTGAPVSGSELWFNGNLSDFQGGAATVNCGYVFDSPHAITHVKMWARNNGSNFNQFPRTFWIEYSDNGTTWTSYKYIYRSGYVTNGEVFLYTLADWGNTDDLSALDEPGGYRYYRFLFDGVTFGGDTSISYIINLILRKSGTYLQPFYHQGSFSRNSPFQVMTATDGAYCNWAANSTTAHFIDFGYKRAVDQVGIRHRSFASGVQGAKTWKLYAGNGGFSVAGTPTLIASIDDTGPNPPGALAERLFSI